ncbi:MAG TPA: hypothetical protein ENN23_01925 [Deltaproteobacteria bacterium]|nr:hypothetical protein [Deltaproteobacteria bacterium]
MGLLKGGFSFARFHVEGDLPRDFLNFAASQIKSHAYRESFSAGQEKSLGWVSLTDVLDSDFTAANYALGDYLVFCLRIDRKQIAPRLLKIKMLEEERRYLAQSGKERIGKQAATAIKEKVFSELLEKQDAVPSFYDVCWSLGKKTVYFSSLSATVADDFVSLFKKTFGLDLKRFSPPESAAALKTTDSPEIISLIGREFLTWLWYKTQERNGRIALNDNEEVELHFVKRIALEAGEGEYAQNVVCSGLHAELTEGKEAVRQGKKVKEAGIRLIHNQNDWEFTFKADNFDFQSLKMPPVVLPETTGDDEGGLLERIYLIEGATKIMDGFFTSFLSLRRSDRWEEETKLMAEWLKH